MDTQAKEYFFKFIRENQSKVLLVFDGLDEADTSNLKMFSNLIESKELSGCSLFSHLVMRLEGCASNEQN